MAYRNFIISTLLIASIAGAGNFIIFPAIKTGNFNRFLTKVQNEKEFKNALLSVTVRKEGDQKNLVTYNSSTRVHPGSNFKLFTAAASLSYLKPDFTFKTRLFLINPDSHKSDLLIVGSGDPTFMAADFKGFIEDLEKIKDEKKIVFENIFYDDSYFSGEKYGPGWAPEWRDLYFAVPITGLQINNNLIEVVGLKNEDQIFEMRTEPLQSLRIRDKRHMVKNSHELKIPITAKMSDQNEIVLAGDTIADLPVRTSATLNDPSLIAALVFKQELVKAGLMSEKSAVRKFSGPPQGKLLHEHSSEPLSTIVTAMLKYSKNNYAETLVRTLGAEIAHAGTQEAGVRVLENFFLDADIPQGAISAFDGSGLSPSTRISGEAVLALFSHVDTQPWSEVFWNALPESQIDGTLKERFKDINLINPVSAKTGTHEFSSSLSGKIIRPEEDLFFSIHIYNHSFTTQESAIFVNPVLDRIVTAIDRQW